MRENAHGTPSGKEVFPEAGWEQLEEGVRGGGTELDEHAAPFRRLTDVFLARLCSIAPGDVKEFRLPSLLRW